MEGGRGGEGETERPLSLVGRGREEEERVRIERPLSLVGGGGEGREGENSEAIVTGGWREEGREQRSHWRGRGKGVR